MALKQDGARWLEQLLNDPGLPQPRAELRPGEEHAGYRTKAVLVNLGWIELRRPYLYKPRAERDAVRWTASGVLSIATRRKCCAWAAGRLRWLAAMRPPARICSPMQDYRSTLANCSGWSAKWLQ